MAPTEGRVAKPASSDSFSVKTKNAPFRHNIYVTATLFCSIRVTVSTVG